MTAPLGIEERDEVENLAAECAERDTLRAHLAELVRLRSFVGVCRRHRDRLPRPVQQVLDARVPSLSRQQQWARSVAANDAEPDPRLPGAPRLL